MNPARIKIVCSAVLMSVLLAACATPVAPTAPAVAPAPEAKPTDAPSTEAAAVAAAAAPATGDDRATTLILAMPSLPINFDPATASAGAENMLQRALYEGLVNFKGDSTTEVEPVLAESYEPNADKSVWTFKLRKGVKFSDGTPFNAENAIAGYKRMMDVGLLGNTISRFTSGDIKNLVAKDEITLEWKCGFVCPNLPQALGTAYGTFFVSPTALKTNEVVKDGKSDLAQEWFKLNAAGTGAYLIESVKPNEEIVFVANKDYWRGWSDPKKFKKIVIRNVAEPSTRRQVLEKGDADISLISTAEDYKAMRDTGNFSGSDKPLYRINYLTYTTKGALKDPRVRQALGYAMDYKGYTESVELGLMQPGSSPWPSGMSSAVGKNGFQYTTDLVKAKALLKEAGIAEGTEITFMYATGYGYYERMGQVLQAQIEQIGLKLKMVERDEGAFNDLFYSYKPYAEIENDLPDMFGYAWWPDFDDFYNYVNPVFGTRTEGSDGAGNGSRYSNAEIDKLLLAAKTETDATKLNAIYQKAHQILMFDDPAGLYVSEPREEILLAKSIKGHPWNPIHVKTFDFYGLSRE